jgi:hypothetical protein
MQYWSLATSVVTQFKFGRAVFARGVIEASRKEKIRNLTSQAREEVRG